MLDSLKGPYWQQRVAIRRLFNDVEYALFAYFLGFPGLEQQQFPYLVCLQFEIHFFFLPFSFFLGCDLSCKPSWSIVNNWNRARSLLARKCGGGSNLHTSPFLQWSAQYAASKPAHGTRGFCFTVMTIQNFFPTCRKCFPNSFHCSYDHHSFANHHLFWSTPRFIRNWSGFVCRLCLKLLLVVM